MIYKLYSLVICLLTIISCAYGPHNSSSKLPDGTILHHEEFTTQGEGIQIKTVDSFRCAREYEDMPVICNPFQHTAASGNSLVVSFFNGAGTAILGSMALGVPAAVLRPGESNVQQSGGGAVSTGSQSSSISTGGQASSESNSTADTHAMQTQSSQAISNAAAIQSQEHIQQQAQTRSRQQRRRHR